LAVYTRFKRLLPTPEQVAASRWLRWLGPALLQPRLWHASRRGIALGVAIGVFFGFLIPLAQIPFSAAAAVALRANLPTAVAATLVTNPVTMPPVYYAAFKLGSMLLGRDEPAAAPQAADERAAIGEAEAEGASGWQQALSKLRNVGSALLLGLALMAVGSALGCTSSSAWPGACGSG
jgi:uncharacterized protein (DUF2062 family)